LSDGRRAHVAAGNTGGTPVLPLGFGDLAGAVGLEEAVEGAELGVHVLSFVGFGSGTGRSVLSEDTKLWDHVVVTI
jgi:hypothetical protein